MHVRCGAKHLSKWVYRAQPFSEETSSVIVRTEKLNPHMVVMKPAKIGRELMVPVAERGGRLARASLSDDRYALTSL